jgi:zinc transport system substrate-binding protein
MKRLLSSLLVVTCIFVGGCRSSKEESAPAKPRVAVSLAPYKYFVERIAGDLVAVDVVIPAGADPHTFEATPKQVEKLFNATLWFTIGEPFERKVKSALRGQKHPIIIDLQEGIGPKSHHHHHETLAQEESCPHCTCSSEDRHYWMSPTLAQHQTSVITKQLIRAFPEHRDIFVRRSALLGKDLQNVHDEIARSLREVSHRWVVVSHPALGHFCKDFGFNQISLEHEGKEPTQGHLTSILERAKTLPVACVMTQLQHNPAGAKWVADQLGVESDTIDPYSEDYLNNLRKISQILTKAAQLRKTPPAVAVPVSQPAEVVAAP